MAMSHLRSPAPRWAAVYLLFVALCVLFEPVVMVKHENFKTCDQSGFCRRNRAYADACTAMSTAWKSPYDLDPASIKLRDGQLSGTIVKTNIRTGEKINLPLLVSFLQSGVARVTIDEEKRQKGEIELRHDSKARKERYNEAEKWAIVGGLKLSKKAALAKGSPSGTTTVEYGPEGKYRTIIQHSPFAVDFQRDGQTQVKFNERGFMNMEHWRPKMEKKQESEGESKEPVEEASGEDESTWWEESFGGNTDTKPRGPESLGLDITFPGYEHVYGIPSHASSMSLKETRGASGGYNEPYRLYNADVFEYEMDSPMTLYGAIPLMQAHRKGSTVGVFWLNGAETWVDIIKKKTSSNPLSLGISSSIDTKTHWISESGIMDVFIFLGPTPQDIAKDYGELTGYTQLPQHFSIAHHQCRWNYVSDQDVMDVDRRFDKGNIPYDVIWLDIEYTDEKKYFTWDPMTFPKPKDMLKQLDDHGRKLVVIIDPHIKNVGGYPVVDELKSKDLAVHNKDGAIYEGWCWPGSSHWIDCFNPAAIDWWKTLYKYDKFDGTGPNVYIWNDMNEPSVFNGPETTMPKDNLHHGNWEHRDIHNINGLTFHNATYEAMLSRAKNELRRPFVLTRSFFSGSQRVGAMWTGDNQANWEHLAASLPMTLNMGISGFPFAGADVGGFFGNTEKELLARWYQAGAFYPFFRAHAHIDTRRREPYLLPSPYKDVMVQALRLRYSLLPAWYTAFHEASTTGAPIVRPNFYVHPSDEKGFGLDDQLYLGGTGLLFKPVTIAGGTSVSIHLPDDQPYYDYFDFTTYTGPGSVTVPAPLEKIPLLMRGGHIIPRRDRPRRSSALMRFDPFTLVVVLDKQGNAQGSLYLDDGETFDFQQGAFVHRNLTFSSTSQTLSSDGVPLESNTASAWKKAAAKYAKTLDRVRVEKVIVVNPPAAWADKKEISVREPNAPQGTPATRRVAVVYSQGGKGSASFATVRDPGVGIARDWKLDFS